MEMDEGVVSQSIDSFWGCELSGAKKCFKYTQSQDTNDGVDTVFELRQACLGPKAKNGERNVVQLTTESVEGDPITHTILSMTLGSNEQVPMFLSVKPPVKLDLVQGSGPVHIVGSQVITLDDTSSDEDEEEVEVESPVKVEAKRKATKRPAESPIQKAPKLAKLVEEEAEEDSEESDEEEEEMELASPSKKGRELPNKFKRPEEFVEANSDGDDDNDEDDEDFEEDEEDGESLENDDSGSPGDNDDSEEEEEEEVRPPKKVDKKVVLKTATFAKPESTKGSFKRGSKGDSERAVHEKTKSILKTPPVTSKGGRSTKSEGSGKKGSQTPLTIEEVKAKLIQSPNLPKKLEKFNNYVTSSFKITDNNTKKKLWEFVQSNRK